MPLAIGLNIPHVSERVATNLSWVTLLRRVSYVMAKKEKSLISIGPQFYTLLALTETIVTELRWGMKKSRRSGKIPVSRVDEPRQVRKRVSGKLKIERL